MARKHERCPVSAASVPRRGMFKPWLNGCDVHQGKRGSLANRKGIRPRSAGAASDRDDLSRAIAVFVGANHLVEVRVAAFRDKTSPAKKRFLVLFDLRSSRRHSLRRSSMCPFQCPLAQAPMLQPESPYGSSFLRRTVGHQVSERAFCPRGRQQAVGVVTSLPPQSPLPAPPESPATPPAPLPAQPSPPRPTPPARAARRHCRRPRP